VAAFAAAHVPLGDYMFDVHTSPWDSKVEKAIWRIVGSDPWTLPTHWPQFVGLVAAVTVILCALTFLPALAVGPLAEGIH
jgi:K+-transporting ATPase A subunit